jgi:hypothetical protein
MFKYPKEPLFAVVNETPDPIGTRFRRRRVWRRRIADCRADGVYVFQVGFPQMLELAKALGTPKPLFAIGASSEAERTKWVRTLEKAIEEAPPMRPSMSVEEDALAPRRMEGYVEKRGDHIKTWRRRYCKFKGMSIFHYRTAMV